MARYRMYVFQHEGETKMMTLEEAVKVPELIPRVQQIISNLRAKRMEKDAFQAGYQEHLGRDKTTGDPVYIGGKLEYQRYLKDHGLCEAGRDFVPRENVLDTNVCASPEFAKLAKEVIPELSDNEVEAISTGEYFEAHRDKVVSDPT